MKPLNLIFVSILLYLNLSSQEASNQGELIFEDNFSKGAENWSVEKIKDEEAKVEVKDNKLHVETVSDKKRKIGTDGVMIWLNKVELPKNFRVTYDVTPTSESGFFLIFFNYKHKSGQDLLSDEYFGKLGPIDGAKTLFNKYVRADMNGYHISYRRNEISNCNFRKNSGMALLGQTTLDKILPKNQKVSVELVKTGGHIKLMVDQTVFMDYQDDGNKNGPVWEGGRIGLRQVYSSTGFYENFKLYKLPD